MDSSFPDKCARCGFLGLKVCNWRESAHYVTLGCSFYVRPILDDERQGQLVFGERKVYLENVGYSEWGGLGCFSKLQYAHKHEIELKTKSSLGCPSL